MATPRSPRINGNASIASGRFRMTLLREHGAVLMILAVSALALIGFALTSGMGINRRK